MKILLAVLECIVLLGMYANILQQTGFKESEIYTIQKTPDFGGRARKPICGSKMRFDTPSAPANCRPNAGVPAQKHGPEPHRPCRR
ncbi:MAG: hypothetical protein ACE5R6_20310 [Candidatus Heimdallarchaeota archaeon]